MRRTEQDIVKRAFIDRGGTPEVSAKKLDRRHLQPLSPDARRAPEELSNLTGTLTLMKGDPPPHTSVRVYEGARSPNSLLPLLRGNQAIAIQQRGKKVVVILGQVFQRIIWARIYKCNIVEANTEKAMYQFCMPLRESQE